MRHPAGNVIGPYVHNPVREVGALKEVSTAADRAELFMPDLEMRKLVGRFIESRLEKQLTAGRTRLTPSAKPCPATTAKPPS
ncbi:MAG: hypothetical protein C0518_00890 [Opitutus sp.]|nr:hypothetical protein [Opitutus sp.]